jgi:hypothetical protein
MRSIANQSNQRTAALCAGDEQLSDYAFGSSNYETRRFAPRLAMGAVGGNHTVPPLWIAPHTRKHPEYLRFGKSLFLDTLAELLAGNEPLFRALLPVLGLDIVPEDVD